ncbi:MAG: hydrolase, partial [Actinomycetia bacterium]|nr:hydrolase [Actinomycetes bacterium]
MSDTPRETTAQTATLLLCGARLTDGRTVDVRLSGPRIEAVGTAGSLTGGMAAGAGGAAGGAGSAGPAGSGAGTGPGAG